MRKPNFFILGAPKCGTTSMHNWLSAHPEIYMSELKEPCFFAADFADRYVTGIQQYERLFEKAGHNQPVVGESSVWYLRSEVAVSAIQSYQKDARYLVCLRNPVDMAISLHSQMVFNGYESKESFEDAWAIQAERQAGREIPRACLEPKEIIYRDACMLGLQLERLYKQVSERQVLTVLVDDLVVEPRREYARILKFLGVADDGKTDFPVENRSKVRASPILQKAVTQVAAIKHRMGVKQGFNVLNTLSRINSRQKGRSPVGAGVRMSVLSFFEQDIRLLERLLGTSLECWFKL